LRAIHRGKLPARKAGKQYLMTRAAIRQFWEGLPMAEQESTEKTS